MVIIHNGYFSSQEMGLGCANKAPGSSIPLTRDGFGQTVTQVNP